MKTLLVAFLVLFLVVPMAAQTDSNIRQAKYYQKQAEYYQRQASYHHRQADAYLRHAEHDFLEAQKYTKRGKTDMAKTASRRAERAMENYKSHLKNAQRYEEKAANNLRLAAKAIEKR